jgi:hypothetical protein
MRLAGSQLVRLATVCCGASAVLIAAAESSAPLRWVAALGLAGAAAAGWRRTRWLTALPGLSALMLGTGGVTTSTALLVGVLLVGFLLLADLADAGDRPAAALVLPADSAAAPATGALAGGSAGGAAGLGGWAHCAGVLWLAGAVGALVVALTAASGAAPIAEVVALAPLLALLAALLAVGHARA